MSLPPRSPLSQPPPPSSASQAASSNEALPGNFSSSKRASSAEGPAAEAPAATAVEVHWEGAESAAVGGPGRIQQQQPKMSKKQAKKAARAAASLAAAAEDADTPPTGRMPSGSPVSSVALGAMPSNAQGDAAMQQPLAAANAGSAVEGDTAVTSSIQTPATTLTRARDLESPPGLGQATQQDYIQEWLGTDKPLTGMGRQQLSQLHVAERQQQAQSDTHMSLESSDESAATSADARQAEQQALHAQQSSANWPAAGVAAQTLARAVPKSTLASPNQSRSPAQKLSEHGPAKAAAAASCAGAPEKQSGSTLPRPRLSPRQPERGLDAGLAPVGEVAAPGLTLRNEVGNAS